MNTISPNRSSHCYAILGLLILPSLFQSASADAQEHGVVMVPTCRAERSDIRLRGGDINTAIGDLNTYAVDAHIGVNDISGNHPIFAPVFRIEGREVKFTFGDFRNLTIDLRGSTIEAFSLTEVLSETGQFGSGDQKHFLGSVVVDKNDRRVFIDQNWVYYPGALRTVDAEGPFATVFVVCTRGGKPVQGADVEMGGSVDKTDKGGWAELKLKNLQQPIVTAKIGDPAHGKTLEKAILVPIVAARPDLIYYRLVHIDFLQ